jgi:peptidoglycan/xylan/chitin deacetylase (PgdA/CDA1 family)
MKANDRGLPIAVRRVADAARRRALKAGYYSGALWLTARLKSARRHRGLLVLMYHSVGEGKDVAPDLRVSEKNFTRQLAYLSDHYAVMSLERSVELLQRGEPLPDNAVAISFDDGYRDNYEIAFPLLRQFGCNATFFVSTAPLIHRRPLWPNQLFLWLAETRATRIELPAVAPHNAPQSLSLATHRKRKKAFRSIEELLFHVGNAERERLLGEIVARLGFAEISAERPAMLTWTQLREMAAAGMTIGSHTETHPVLATLSRSEALRELAASRAALERELGRRVTLFAYPFGGPGHFTAETRKLVEEAGYNAACSTLGGINGTNADMLALKRVGVQDDPPALFAFKLSRLQN